MPVTRVLLKCVDPSRRDALEETARLALSFVTVTCGPGFPDFKASRDLAIHLTEVALRKGCHLPDVAQELLEAVQAHGVSILRGSEPGGEITPEWKDWWKTLPEAPEEEYSLVLEIR